jgi:hypothetical protein
MLDIWTVKSGYNFGVIDERSKLNLSLPVSYSNNFDDSVNVDFKVISGSLPPGLRLTDGKIVGTPFEVPRPTEFKFVIRASYNNEIADRTFVMTVDGDDAPEWRTASGSLPIGVNDAYFILDNTYVDFQLQVVDSDTASGQTLKYFIPSGGGELPPGLILTDSGRIVGWVQPLLAPPLVDGNGNYDVGFYDKVAFDYGIRPNNGYDSYIFDSVIFDFGTTANAPRKLNRNFEFNVIVTDGDNSTSRKFRIYVVGDDYFRSDNTALRIGNNTFTADATFAKAPIWTTPNDLGYFRANNYKTFKLDVYEGIADQGPIIYELESVNPDIVCTAFTNSDVENRAGFNKLRIKLASGVPQVNYKIQFREYVDGAPPTVHNITQVITISPTDYLLTVSPALQKTVFNNTILYLGTASILPPGMQFDPGTSEVFGVLPYQTAVLKQYNFTIKAIRTTSTNESVASKRTFTANILGEIDSTINFISDSNLGSIGANYVSTLKIEAETTLPNAQLLYYIIDGNLPPGLSLNLDGEIVGKVNQFYNAPELGLITFDNRTFSLDERDTTIDRSYTFTVEAKDVLKYSAVRKSFTIYVDTPNDRLYSSLVVKPFLKTNQREVFKTFITDPDIFNISSIYRPTDINFGIQKELKMLVYAGIETKSAAQVVSAIGRNHKPKRFKFGSVKKARAREPGTTTTIYEVIYIEMLDPLEIGDKFLSSPIRVGKSPLPITVDQNNQFYEGPFNQINPYWQRPSPFLVTTDRNDMFAGDSETGFMFPASISIWRKRIESIGLKERNFMPLWMRTIQEGQVQELGYVKAVPLCYCKPGQADDILLNIKNSGFDFNQLEYQIDRYIIDSVTGYNEDKYIAFKNDRTTIT